MSAAWHAEALRLRDLRTPTREIARLVGRSQSVVYDFLVPDSAERRREKKRQRRERDRKLLTGVRARSTGRADRDRSGVANYVLPQARPSFVTLPHVSILEGNGVRYQLAPKGYFS